MKADLDPILKAKLQQVSRQAGRPWPDWRRGLIGGVIAMLPGFALSYAIFCAARSSTALAVAGGIAMALIIGICVGLPLAFRPQK